MSPGRLIRHRGRSHAGELGDAVSAARLLRRVESAPRRHNARPAYPRLGAVLVAALGTLALLAPTAEAKELPKAKFKLSVNGSQTTTFSNSDSKCAGSGSEDVTFATAQPIKVTVVLVKAHGQSGPAFNFGKVPSNGFGDPSFDVNAVVHRAQNWTATTGCTFEATGSCEATAQTGWELSIFASFEEANTIVIENAQSGGDDPLAESCRRPEALGTYFPQLLSYDEVARRYLVIGSLSTRALFREGKKRLTSNANGSDHVDFFSESTDTTTSWTVTLERIG